MQFSAASRRFLALRAMPLIQIISFNLLCSLIQKILCSSHIESLRSTQSTRVAQLKLWVASSYFVFNFQISKFVTLVVKSSGCLPAAHPKVRSQYIFPYVTYHYHNGIIILPNNYKMPAASRFLLFPNHAKDERFSLVQTSFCRKCECSTDEQRNSFMRYATALCLYASPVRRGVQSAHM